MLVRWKRLDPALTAIAKRPQYEAGVGDPMSPEVIAAVAKFEIMLREKANAWTRRAFTVAPN